MIIYGTFGLNSLHFDVKMAFMVDPFSKNAPILNFHLSFEFDEVVANSFLKIRDFHYLEDRLIAFPSFLSFSY